MMLSYKEKRILTKHYAPMIISYLKVKQKHKFTMSIFDNEFIKKEITKYLRDFQVLYVQRKMKNLEYEFPHNIHNELLNFENFHKTMDCLYCKIGHDR